VSSDETKDDLLAWLQTWYENHCDDDWEHGYGISGMIFSHTAL
jgi:hypothetical protein